MNTFEIMKKVIAGGMRNDEELLMMCDVFLMNNRITSDQYNELVALIA